MNSSLVVCALALLVSTSACASLHKQQAPRDHSVITREQIELNKFNSAFEAVQSLRSNWLQARGPDSFHTPSIVLVYYDAVRLGGVETLRTIHTRNVDHIRHYDGIEATSRWGVGHSAGVILVSAHPASQAARRN